MKKRFIAILLSASLLFTSVSASSVIESNAKTKENEVVTLDETRAMTADEKLSAPVLKMSSVSYDSVTLKWTMENISEVAGYNIYEIPYSKIDNYKKNDLKLIAKVESGATFTYTVSDLENAKNYYYLICAYDSNKTEGNYSEYVKATTKTLGVSTLKSITNISNTSVKLNFSKVSAATAYEIYRSNSKTSGFKRIATVTTTNYLDENLTCGRTYYYKIRTVKNNNLSEFSNVLSIKAKPAKIKVTLRYDSALSYVRINFKTVEGATGYTVYKSLSKDGSFKRIAKIKSGKELTFIDKDVKKGQKYYYMVKAYKTTKTYGNIYSDSSVVKTVKMIPKAVDNLNAASSTYNSVKLTWKASSKAEGYRIYYSTNKEGSYTLAADIKGQSKTATIVSSLKCGKKYYFKVRAYQKDDNNKKIIGYSSEIKCTKPVPSAPSVKITASASNKLILSWKKVAGAKSYVVLRRLVGESSYKIVKAGLTNTEFTNSKLKAGQKYVYKVYAIRGLVVGKYSKAVSKMAVSLDVSVTSTSILKGGKLKITATASPKATVKWSSSKTSVATVSSKGVVSAKKNGTAYIYAKANGIQKKIKVVVFTQINGIDVSKWQGSINWSQVKASGIGAAILRVGSGNNVASQDDPTFATNANGCQSVGMSYGVYIYSYALNISEAVSEADHVARMLKGRSLSYPIFLDMEDGSQGALSNSQILDIAKTFIGTLRDKYGYTNVGIYANYYWWTTKLTDSYYDGYKRWVARYNSFLGYNKSYFGWQYSSTGRVAGIAGNVDMDYFYG
ncbi:Lyzozyme M1 (1,4-beta-N-acetylmuramidase), GH25 family [Acetitomaculum ruminis DSM 5522]|uniref:Lyzozyme M1 (1,4-beta-N-acetylmuramidase), GH25 family n=1 Tax=Acetitomaculum ruminis DSM 5522 TaxID=1120918 RepID=A0A1I1AEK7_9FIRM|nr:GH25 family lysozyme [Acetitomaculum ruminis]SFB35932.1 Lyzozyme M1 (1,4-beta-N-acetylmuramidase), GH25 family [Acetitomaculum ruminis DSM 5522]